MSSQSYSLLQKNLYLNVPGINLPINWKLREIPRSEDCVQPLALDLEDICEGWVGYIYTTRELLMMRLMEAITDKTDWNWKVFDETITAGWREEIFSREDDVSTPMMDWMISELQWRAEEYEKLGMVECYSPGVVKSDTAIPENVQQALRNAVRPIEDVPAVGKDHHPHSDEKVVDLVDPALFPLVWGRTWVLHDRTISLNDCLQNIGMGKPTEVPKIPNYPVSGFRNRWRHGLEKESLRAYSYKYQWLPCDIYMDSDGRCRLESYINNLHPAKNRDLYCVIEDILTRAVPLWQSTLYGSGNYRPHRIPYTSVEYVPLDEIQSEPAKHEEALSAVTENRYTSLQGLQVVQQPEPGVFSPAPPGDTLPKPDLRDYLLHEGLQVIVKLSNIELTPDKPDYGEDTWHIEGQLNERICATALYYYDSENITETRLAFRHRANIRYIKDISYPPGEFQFLPQVFGLDQDLGTDFLNKLTQDLGTVSCRQGRLLTFPSTIEHRVAPFSLANPSKPGHLKFLTLFLVDPNRRIVSTANVPPQREDWCRSRQDLIHQILRDRLPPELEEIIQRDLGFQPITMQEGKEYRLDMMAENSRKAIWLSSLFETGGFSLDIR